jgi:hypothetical protein
MYTCLCFILHTYYRIEVGNSGMFRPEMLEPMGLPPGVRVIAWGLGLGMCECVCVLVCVYVLVYVGVLVCVCVC